MSDNGRAGLGPIVPGFDSEAHVVAVVEQRVVTFAAQAASTGITNAAARRAARHAVDVAVNSVSEVFAVVGVSDPLSPEGLPEYLKVVSVASEVIPILERLHAARQLRSHEVAALAALRDVIARTAPRRLVN